MNKKSTSQSQNYSQFIGKTYQLSKHTIQIEDVIAEGGFSIVFLAKSTKTGQKYALKRMYVNNDFDLEACKFEIKILKTFSSNKNILKYVDSSIQRQTNEIYEILLLTKYCKLGGLVQLMNERFSSNSRFQENEILKIFCDVCLALNDLHTNEIIHRDLKVENILIDEDEMSNLSFILCDYGSATKRVFDRKQNQSMTQLIADEIQKYTTLSYRSPEMVDLYSDKPITTKSDIWALGCLLYKLCYFQMPFGESLLAIQEGRFTIPDSKFNFYSKQLNILINYMLEPDPIKRPDIFQVSYLAFSMLQKQTPIQNKNGSDIPNFDQLSPPFSESEWKKHSLNTAHLNLNHKKLANTNESSTTVNPRERPKPNQNINQTPILSLTNTSSSLNNNQNKTKTKIALSIKPVQQDPFLSQPKQEQEPLGFEDDFNSINLNQQMEKPTVEKKTHRRSASHSSTIFSTQFNTTLQISSFNNNHNSSQSRLTPNQLPQQHQINIESQQFQQYQQQFQNNNKFINHSRSASASPNVVGLTIKEETIINKNPFDNDSNNQNNLTNNEEIDLFGAEFDKLRSNNINTSNNNINSSSNNNFNIQVKCIEKSSSNEDTSNSKSYRMSTDDEYLEDPFRKAPFNIYNPNKSSSSSSSNSFASSENVIQNDTIKIGTHSAFQPYKKQPDPFVSAPFDHLPNERRKVSISSNSTSSSVTPTQKCEFMSKNEEIIKVINTKLDSNLKTPSTIKKSKSNNPFMDAPFTVKKTLNTKNQYSSSSQHKTSNNTTPTLFNQQFKIQTSQSLNEIKHTSHFDLVKNSNSGEGGISNMSFDEY